MTEALNNVKDAELEMSRNETKKHAEFALGVGKTDRREGEETGRGEGGGVGERETGEREGDRDVHEAHSRVGTRDERER